MGLITGSIPDELGKRNTFYRDLIPYIHDNILRLTTISAADQLWLSAQLLLFIIAYDAAENGSSTSKDLVDARNAIDGPIHDKLEIVIANMIPWTPKTTTDMNHFGLHERAAGNSDRTVVSNAPSEVIMSQSHLGAKTKAIDPLHPNATKLPIGVFMVIWVGYLVTTPAIPNPAPVLLGWSTSIDADLEFPALWLKQDAMAEAYYVDKHHNKSAIAAPVPITVI
jgi:hypothetical protein